MTGFRAAIVHLGRESATGERRRVQSWERMVAAAGGTSCLVALRTDHRRRAALPRARDLGPLLRGGVVPETQSWSLESARRAIVAAHPDLVVFVTSRAFHPALVGLARRSVLDLVDSLAVSYGDRARVTPGPGGAALGALSWCHARFEARSGPLGVTRVAAGWSDARALGATWIPNVVEVTPPPSLAAAVVDLLFIGNLAYPPNVGAVRRLAGLWPAIQRQRPGTTAMLAGRRPTAAVTAIAAELGWRVAADFGSVPEIASQARLAVAPLELSAGIQNKVLDAAAAGLAQVVSPEAVLGMPPGFPAQVASSDAELVAEIARLLDDPGARTVIAQRAQEHVRAEYSAARWAPAITELVG